MIDRFDDDSSLFFALDNAMFDTSIAAWDAKRYRDSEAAADRNRDSGSDLPRLPFQIWVQ
jgi:hypothetical protein